MDINFKDETTRAVGLVLILLLIAAITQLSSLGFMKDASKRVLIPLDYADSVQNTIINIPNIHSNKIIILKKQYIIATKTKEYYQGIAISYYYNYYAFTICGILFATFLTIAVFLVANKGWQNCSLVLKTFLLANIVLSSIYYFLPNALKNEENLKNNIEKIRMCHDLQTDILSFLNTYYEKETTNKQIDSAIITNFKRISKDRDFLNSIDNSKISSEINSLISKATAK